MRQKLITLCPNSFELAQKKPNFSAWVREKLLEEGKEPEKITNYVYKCPLCKVSNSWTTRIARKCVKCNYPLNYERNYSEWIE